MNGWRNKHAEGQQENYIPPPWVGDNYVTCKCFLFLTSFNVSFDNGLTLSQTSPGFTCLQYKSFENTLGKGEMARNKQFLLSPQCFLPVLENFPPFLSNLKLSSAKYFRLEQSKICHLGKGQRGSGLNGL